MTEDTAVAPENRVATPPRPTTPMLRDLALFLANGNEPSLHWLEQLHDHVACLVDALHHIGRTAERSRTSTRRLRWIQQRAEWALLGRPYVQEQFDLPRDPGPETVQRLKGLVQDLRDELGAVRAQIAIHGVSCPKAEHGATGGYQHQPDDDGPYDVDGVTYCGRCHGWMGTAVPPDPQPIYAQCDRVHAGSRCGDPACWVGSKGTL